MERRQLLIKQLDRQFSEMSPVKSYPRPAEGWVRTLRKALGMTILQLAKRLGKSTSRITKIESDEVANALTLRTLKDVAAAMECELHYVLLPKTSIQETLGQQAKKVATKKMNRIDHSMLLEDQAVDKKILAEQLDDLIVTLLSGNPNRLWEDNE